MFYFTSFTYLENLNLNLISILKNKIDNKIEIKNI